MQFSLSYPQRSCISCWRLTQVCLSETRKVREVLAMTLFVTSPKVVAQNGNRSEMQKVFIMRNASFSNCLIPSLIIVSCYLNIFIFITERSRTMQPNGSSPAGVSSLHNASMNQVLRKLVNTAEMVSGIAVLFFLTYYQISLAARHLGIRLLRVTTSRGATLGVSQYAEFSGFPDWLSPKSVTPKCRGTNFGTISPTWVSSKNGTEVVTDTTGAWMCLNGLFWLGGCSNPLNYALLRSDFKQRFNRSFRSVTQHLRTR